MQMQISAPTMTRANFVNLTIKKRSNLGFKAWKTFVKNLMRDKSQLVLILVKRPRADPESVCSAHSSGLSHLQLSRGTNFKPY